MLNIPLKNYSFPWVLCRQPTGFCSAISPAYFTFVTCLILISLVGPAHWTGYTHLTGFPLADIRPKHKQYEGGAGMGFDLMLGMGLLLVSPSMRSYLHGKYTNWIGWRRAYLHSSDSCVQSVLLPLPLSLLIVFQASKNPWSINTLLTRWRRLIWFCLVISNYIYVFCFNSGRRISVDVEYAENRCPEGYFSRQGWILEQKKNGKWRYGTTNQEHFIGLIWATKLTITLLLQGKWVTIYQSQVRFSLLCYYSWRCYYHSKKTM